MWLRRTMDESENFTLAVAERSDRGSLKALRAYPRECLIVVGLTVGGTIAFYTFTTYMQKFMVNTTGLPKEQVTLINFVALVIFVCLQPVFGALSDRIGRRPTSHRVRDRCERVHGPVVVRGVAGRFGVVGLLADDGGTCDRVRLHLDQPVVKAELFTAHVRALGVGLPYALTVAIFGGTTEYVALGLKHLGHETLFFYYVGGAALVSLLVYVFMGESSQHRSCKSRPPNYAPVKRN